MTKVGNAVLTLEFTNGNYSEYDIYVDGHLVGFANFVSGGNDFFDEDIGYVCLNDSTGESIKLCDDVPFETAIDLLGRVTHFYDWSGIEL